MLLASFSGQFNYYTCSSGGGSSEFRSQRANMFVTGPQTGRNMCHVIPVGTKVEKSRMKISLSKECGFMSGQVLVCSLMVHFKDLKG